MNKTLEKKLVKAFPKLYRDYGGDMKKTCMHWGFACGDGWFELIWNLSNYLKWAAPRARALQVKEKLGTLRFYVDDGGDDTHDVKAMVSNTEWASCCICETCGKAGRLRITGGWRYTACDKCAKPIAKRII
jgi:hypothetical protein